MIGSRLLAPLRAPTPPAPAVSTTSSAPTTSSHAMPDAPERRGSSSAMTASARRSRAALGSGVESFTRIMFEAGSRPLDGARSPPATAPRPAPRSDTPTRTLRRCTAVADEPTDVTILSRAEVARPESRGDVVVVRSAAVGGVEAAASVDEAAGSVVGTSPPAGSLGAGASAVGAVGGGAAAGAGAGAGAGVGVGCSALGAGGAGSGWGAGAGGAAGAGGGWGALRDGSKPSGST